MLLLHLLLPNKDGSASADQTCTIATCDHRPSVNVAVGTTVTKRNESLSLALWEKSNKQQLGTGKHC